MSPAAEALFRVAAMLREAIEARDWEAAKRVATVAEDRALRLEKGEA